MRSFFNILVADLAWGSLGPTFLRLPKILPSGVPVTADPTPPVI